MIGQEEAIQALSKAVKRGRVGLKDPARPIGSFLFLGPTGVGKTELSKALAEALFGNEEDMIRVDMSEYMEKHSVSKMIGSPPGYVGHEDGGQLSEKVRRNPYSVILFDEIEKAHPDVFNILLQVLDDGHITDSQGRKVDFRNTVIIMTSNAGAKAIIEPKKLGFTQQEDQKADYKRMKANVMDEVKQLFRPEFLNRIDEIIVFHPLNEDNMKKIVGLMCKEVVQRAKEQLEITLVVRDSVKKHIVETGSDKKYGARPLRRAVQSQLEDKLAEALQKPIKDPREKGKLLNKKIESDKLLNSYKNDVIFGTKLHRDSKYIVIASNAIVKYGNEIFFLIDGINYKFKNFNANHLLKWKIIEEYSKKGFTKFHFNGITGDFTKKNKYTGLLTFKKGFNAVVTEYIGEYTFVFNHLKYGMYKMIKPVLDIGGDSMKKD